MQHPREVKERSKKAHAQIVGHDTTCNDVIPMKKLALSVYTETLMDQSAYSTSCKAPVSELCKEKICNEYVIDLYFCVYRHMSMLIF